MWNCIEMQITPRTTLLNKSCLYSNLQGLYTTLLGCWLVLICIVCMLSVLTQLDADWASTVWPGTTRYFNMHWDTIYSVVVIKSIYSKCKDIMISGWYQFALLNLVIDAELQFFTCMFMQLSNHPIMPEYKAAVQSISWELDDSQSWF